MAAKENFPGLMRCSNSQGRAMMPVDGKVLTGVGNNRKNTSSNKNNAIRVYRPITRNFAKRAAIEQKQEYQEVQPLPKPALIPLESKDCIIIEAEEDEVPSFVQHAEAMLEEIYRMDAEVGMEGIYHEVEEQVMDIDINDKKNPLAVAEYIDEIYNYYKKKLSCVPPNFMDQQPDINERMESYSH